MASLRVINLGSSSRGNCTYYEFGETRILIDAGLSARQIELRLLEVGSRIESITDVLITHEHQDHIGAVEVLAKKYPNINFYANYATGKAAGYVANFRVFETGRHFFLRPSPVIAQALAVPHSAAEPVGFRLWFGDTACIHLTDLGYVSDELVTALADSDIILIESNYDRDMLEKNQESRPFSTHMRNFGRTGHLSNVESAQALLRAKHLAFDCGDPWDPVVCLLHLSKTYNSPELALIAARDIAGVRAFITQENHPTGVDFVDELKWRFYGPAVA